MLLDCPLLGYLKDDSVSFGLAGRQQSETRRSRRLITHRGEAHVLCIGQTGSLKTVQAIDNALTWRGSLIVLDVGGDITRATYRFRRDVLKQKTHVIDPFGITGKPKARLDPFAMFSLPGVEIEAEAELLANMLLSEQFENSRDIYWPRNAATLLAADIVHSVRSTLEELRTIQQVVGWLYSDDVAYKHAVMLDTEVKKGSYEAAGIASWLQLPDGSASTRFCVTSTAHAAIGILRSESIRSCLGPSTINLMDLLDGKPTTIYIAIPIERVNSAGAVLRLWVETILQALVRRTVNVDPPTLMMIDETAQLGKMKSLLTAVTYLRNRSTKVWCTFQDAGQIRSVYGQDFSTLVNNCSAVLINAGNYMAARDLAEVVGVAPGKIAGLRKGEQLVVETSGEQRIVRIPRYWLDRRFVGRFDPLTRFGIGNERTSTSSDFRCA